MERRAYLYFVSTFLLGVLTGAVGLYLYAWYGGHWRRPVARGQFVRYLTHELGLSAEQTNQLNQILVDSRKKYEQLRVKARPPFEELRQQTDSEIRQILKPEQSRKFDEVIRKWRSSESPPLPRRPK